MKQSKILTLIIGMLISSFGFGAEKSAVPPLQLMIPMIIDQAKLLQESSISDRNLVLVEKFGKKFYCVHKKVLTEMSPIERIRMCLSLKELLLTEMGLPVATKVVQVVGDSDAFSVDSTERACEFLDKNIDDSSLIMFGYTGHVKEDGRRCVNAQVRRVIEERGLLNRTIGNLVGHHSRVALQNWGCSGPDLNYYILVYGDDDTKKEQGALFGDDIPFDALADMMVSIEGGIQSFSQICNTLLLKRPVIGLSDLRGEIGQGYFSAPGFFGFLKNKLADVAQEDINPELLEHIKDEYFTLVEIADPKRKDYSTKEGLFQDAWKLFIVCKLYQRLDLITYVSKLEASSGPAKI